MAGELGVGDDGEKEKALDMMPEGTHTEISADSDIRFGYNSKAVIGAVLGAVLGSVLGSPPNLTFETVLTHSSPHYSS